MSLLTKASTVTTPTAYSRGQLHSVKPFDVENLLLQSNTFSDTVWAGASTTETSGQNGYDGSNNAWLLTKIVANGNISQSVNGSNVMAFSVYAKASANNWLRLNIVGVANAYFDLANGVVGSTSGAAAITSVMADLGNGWYRCSFIYDVASTTGVAIYVADSDGSSSGASGSIYIQDAQLNKGYTALQYIETTTSALPSADFDFARASSATRVNEQGYIEDVPYNLVQQSNTFDTTWTTNLVSVTGGQTGYDGSSDAWLLQDTASIGEHRLRQSLSQYGIETISVYAKANTLDYLWLRGVNSGSNVRAYFNLSTGTLGTSSGTLIDYNIASVGSGWYRCSLTLDQQSGFEYYIGLTNADGSATYTGTGSGSIYIQDAQIVKGTDAKDYLETTDRQDIPRINYEGGNGHFLLEPSRTNAISDSNDFGATNWTSTLANVTSNEAISPEGIENASKLITTASTGNHQIDATNCTISSGAVTGSVFAKKGDNISWLRLRLSGTSSPPRAWFDLENGVVGDVDITGSATIEDYGNGWYRCSLTEAGNTAAGSGGRLQIFLNESNAQTSFTANGDEYHYIYGAQLEQGSYPTSYIPTYGSSVTRAAETCNNAGNSDLFNDSEGVLYAEIAALDDDGTFRLMSISDGTSSNRITLGFSNTSNNILVQIHDGGVAQVNFNKEIDNTTLFNKIALKYKLNDVAFWVNGVEITTDTSATMPSGLSELNLNYTDTLPLYAKTKMVSTFTEALSDSELECLTSWSSFNRMATAQNYNIE